MFMTLLEAPQTDDLLPLDNTVEILKAIGEPSRLRIVAVLQHGECSVSDLCEILGQSQPRISRHLRLLVDAGVCSRHREGSFVFFGLERQPQNNNQLEHITHSILSALHSSDPQIEADRDRLFAVRQRVSQHIVESALLSALNSALPSSNLGNIVDIGTGTGRMIELLADHSDRVVGLDSNAAMLRVARATLDSAGIHRAELRHADLFAPLNRTDRFDLVIVHQVLHYLDNPDRAIEAITRLASNGGTVAIVDLMAHENEILRMEHAHRRLGFDNQQIVTWCRNAGLNVRHHQVAEEPESARLSVGIWLAQKGRDQ
ncbi:MAG: methyltransferase domain-containing protein [Actinobacteria bacterium]|nr:methyltransferase domain-containing protein [Actinomycetota bacterium]